MGAGGDEEGIPCQPLGEIEEGRRGGLEGALGRSCDDTEG